MVTFNSSMDALSPLPDLFAAAAPPPTSSTGVPIAAIIAVGFFATSLVLTIYYMVVVRFWLNNHQSRQAQNSYMPSIFFTYETEGRGVDPSIIKSIPVVIFKKSEDGEENKNLTAHECAVCLADFQEKESIKVLPGCSHAFHIDCIDTWLQFNVNCPMCRAVVSSSSLVQKLDYDIEGQIQMELRGDDQHEGDAACRDVTGIRRSFSMDWFSHERRIKRGEASTSSGAAINGDTSGRFMRLVHSFRLGRSSRSAVLPIQMEP